MLLRGVEQFLGFACPLGMLALLVLLVRKGLRRSFPVFTFFVAEELFWAIAEYLLRTRVSRENFGLFYRSMSILDEVLQLFVFYELAKHIFCPTGKWAKDVRNVFLWMMAACFVVAFALTAVDHPAAHGPTQLFILRAYFVSAVLMSELFVATAFLAATAGLPWKTHVARIAQGLGAYSLICVVFDLIISYTGVPNHHALYQRMFDLRFFTWFICEIYWIVALWQEAPEPRDLPVEMRTQIYALNRRVEYDLGRIRSWRT